MTRWLVSATVVGLAVRVAFALVMPIAVAEDASDYHRLAARVAAGDGFTRADGTPTAFRPPGFPLFLAACYIVAGIDPVVGRIAQCLVGALLIPLVGFIACGLAGSRAGQLGAILTALYPPFVSSWFSARALLSEVLLTTLLALSLALATMLARGERRATLAVLCGVACGCAILTKATVVFMPFLIAAYLCWSIGTGRARWTSTLGVLFGAATVVVPWTVRNYFALGGLVPVSTNGGISVWASYNPASRGLGNGEEGYASAVAEDDDLRVRLRLGEVERSRHFFARVRDEVASRPGRALWLVARKVLLFWDPTLKDWSQVTPPTRYNWAYGAVLPLAAVGLLRSTGGSVLGLRLLLVVTAAAFSAMHILLHTDVRYRVPIEPILLVFAAVTVSTVIDRAGAKATAAALGAWLAVHGVLAWRYDVVFGALSTVVRWVGLG